MDSSLINLIPSLTARRSTTLPQSEHADPPPPYTLDPNPNPQPENKPATLTVPLHFDYLGVSRPQSPQSNSTTWSFDDTVSIGPDTTFWQFLLDVKLKMRAAKVPRVKPWHYSILAEVRGRAVWQFYKLNPDVHTDSWEQVVEGLREGRFRGFKVECWRDDNLHVVDPSIV